jgi:NTE family protein
MAKGPDAPAESGQPQTKKHRVALGLQGGGAHGAFTWGIVDRLLADPTLEIIGVTGASAGAMNAIVLADGLVRGGPQLARTKLREFWEEIGTMIGFGTFIPPLPGEMVAGMKLEDTPLYAMWDMLSHFLSPYDLNPNGWHPLVPLLTRMIDFDALRARADFPVLVCATNARTSRRRVFTNADMTLEAVLASACLPKMFQAIEIDGEPYWDGGFTGNPAIIGLLPRLPDCDLLVVRIDPMIRSDTPRTVSEIHDRVVEISFNSTFWLELMVLGVFKTFADIGLLKKERFHRIRFHMLEASNIMEKFPRTSKSNNNKAMLEYLFTIGSETADTWLARNRADLGKRSTYDLRELLPTGSEDLLGWRSEKLETSASAQSE